MEQTIDDLMNEERETNLAAEQLRMKLNALIARHQLSAQAALHILARISAGYIHALQRAYSLQGLDFVAEEDFQHMLTAYLTSLDMNDVAGEMQKMSEKEMN